MNQKAVLFVGIALYLISAVASYAYFSRNSVNTGSYQAPVAQNGETEEDGAPKTEVCPINGAMHTASDKAKWEKRRPLGIAVENTVDARPQSGLSSADVIYEAVAEGGITRFLGIYYCDDAKIVGPVRSARIYFIKLLQGYGEYPLYSHVGGANTPGPADALGEIRDLGWDQYNDLSQFAVPFPNYWRDYDRLPGVATEHTMYTDPTKLWAYAAKNVKLSNVDEEGTSWDESFTPWKFQDGAKEGSRGDVAKISYGFWDASVSTMGVEWNYDAASNLYKRVNGGVPHTDKNTDEQLTASTVVAAMVDESPANDGYPGGHLLYDLVGTGDAYIFMNGKVIEGTWTKESEEDAMVFSDDKGKELELVRGKIWVSIVPTGNKITY